MPLVGLESCRIRLWASRMPWQYRTRRQSLDRRTLYDRVLTSSNHVMWVSLREDRWWVLVLVEEVIMLWVLVLVGRLYRHSVLGLCHTIHAEIFLFVLLYVVIVYICRFSNHCCVCCLGIVVVDSRDVSKVDQKRVRYLNAINICKDLCCHVFPTCSNKHNPPLYTSILMATTILPYSCNKQYNIYRRII